jgi:L-asparagine oxygenase
MVSFDKGVAGPPASEARVQPLDAEKLWGAIGRLIDRDLETFTPDEFVDLALAVQPLLPPDVRRRVIEYRRRAPNGDVLLLRGLLPSHVMLGPTATSQAAPISGPAQRAALLLVGVTLMFGEPFNYASLWDGRLVQHMVPVRGKEFSQTSQSSSGMLDWHVEDGFRDDRCDYAGLLCLRGDPAGASRYAQARDLQLSPDVAATLREPRFQMRPDTAHVLPGKAPIRRLAVLTGPESAPEICYDMHGLTPIDDADTAAAAALRELRACLDEVHISHVMERGDLLVFDNRRVVHARTPFAARFDGTDRWLMRTMICGSAVTFRRWGRRVPE